MLNTISKTCPVCNAIDVGSGEIVIVQGKSIRVCCRECAEQLNMTQRDSEEDMPVFDCVRCRLKNELETLRPAQRAHNTHRHIAKR